MRARGASRTSRDRTGTGAPAWRRLPLAALALALALQAPLAPARAQSGEVKGGIEATAYEPVPAQSSVEIRQTGSTEASFETARLLAKGLAGRGFRLRKDDADYRLSFRLAIELDIDTSPDTALRVENDALMLRSNRLRRAKPPSATQPRIILLRLEDRDGNLIWSARGWLREAPEDPLDVATTLAPILVEHMFESVPSLAIH